MIAGASGVCVDALDHYGRAIGLAFQIIDDLLDVQGEESTWVSEWVRTPIWANGRIPRFWASWVAASALGADSGSYRGDQDVWPTWRPVKRPSSGSFGKGSLMNQQESILRRVHLPSDLKGLSEVDLDQLASEMRNELIGVLGRRSAHFASNLGVVELCLARFLTFDFTTTG